jgi:hypothetical protein
MMGNTKSYFEARSIRRMTAVLLSLALFVFIVVLETIATLSNPQGYQQPFLKTVHHSCSVMKENNTRQTLFRLREMETIFDPSKTHWIAHKRDNHINDKLQQQDNRICGALLVSCGTWDSN